MGGAPMCCEVSSKQAPTDVVNGQSPEDATKKKKSKDKGKDKNKDTNPQEPPSFSKEKNSTGGDEPPGEAGDLANAEEEKEPEAAEPDSPGGSKRKSFTQLQRCESKEERDFTKQSLLAVRLISELGIETDKGDELDMARAHSRKANRRPSIIENFCAEEDEGPQLTFPITFEAAETLRAHYTKNGPAKKLNERITDQLVSDFTEKYRELHPSPISEISLPTDGKKPKLVIVGDTHGQLQDVLYIFNTHGPPSASNVYLFNGDVADRGPNSCEIFLLIFIYFLADPTCILMNRGNHESEEMNALELECGGGFRDEVFQKYDSKMYWKFVAMMKSLQLITIINKEVFVVHGGLSSVELTLDFIRSIKHTECTMPEPGSTSKQDIAFNDFLWSDPRNDKGKQNSSRGVGILFGPDITARFIKDNPPIKMMVRSHQMPEEQRGFQKQTGGKCITIFSASNYCGDSGNQGAVMIFEPKNFPEYSFSEYYAPSLAMMAKLVGKGDKDWANAGKALREQEKKLIEDNMHQKELKSMIVSIVENKPEILENLLSDAKATTIIDFEKWSSVMQSVLGGAWRWDLAWQTWKLGDAKDKLNMKDFLSRFSVVLSKEEYMAFKMKAITAVYECILHEHTSLAATLELFDKDGDGTVDMSEMKEAISSMDLTLTDQQKDSLVHTLFKNAPEAEDGVPKLLIKDFLSRFTIVYKNATSSMTGDRTNSEQQLSQEAMSKVAQLIASTRIDDLNDLNPKMKGKKGRKDVKRKTGKKATTADLKKMAVEKASGHTSSKLATKIEALFAAFDADNSGELDLEEFRDGILALPGVGDIKLSNGEKLGPKRVTAMAKVVDHSGDGSISILELLEAFCFEDSGGDDMGDSLAEHMLTVLFRHRQALRAGARCFDADSTGNVTRDEFFKVLMALNTALASEIDKSVILESQASDLCDALAVDSPGGGKDIVYEDFFNSFMVVDRENPSLSVKLGRRRADDVEKDEAKAKAKK